MIRVADKEDIPFIISCLQAMRYESSNCFQCEDDPEYVAGNLHALMEHDSFIGLIADDSKGVMLGITQALWYDKRLRTYEQLLYVAPEHRGSMTAARLIRRLCDTAKEHGSIEVQAGSMAEIKEQSLYKLYKRLGFEDYKCGVRFRIT